ncbi:MAG: adenylosuccinate lyase [Chlamydiales bacterium]|nr:adenylosuccinate lyase [Chlamydiales bacterium]
MDLNRYQSPLSERYASKEMSYLFSPHYKYTTWRRLWLCLAKAQKACGLDIQEEQILSLEKKIDSIDFEKVQEYEKRFRHDVVAHIHDYAQDCPEASSIIHLGATSCFVTDNTDMLQMHEGLKLIRNKVIQLLQQLHPFASKYAHLPCLAYTHFQPAQPTTVGKRATLWLQDFLIDLEEIEHTIQHIRFLGAKGATGTQASFLSLFKGDARKVDEMEQLIAKEMGFTRLLSISGQTYTRKQDIQIASTLSSFAASAHKCATDIRLLSHLEELEEPFTETQVGSSAMPYKRNPMRSERICGLSRFLISLNENALYTESTQWLERTLDDSSNRRLYIPEMFLTADAILQLLCNITANLTVNPRIIQKHLDEKIPFFATEEILAEAVRHGKDRQIVHECLRIHSLEVARRIKELGGENTLLEQIAEDPAIGLSLQEIRDLCDSKRFIGRAIDQVHGFLNQELLPRIAPYQNIKHFYPDVPI